MVQIKEAVRALSYKFMEIEIALESTAEEVFRQVTDLVQSLQVKVSDLEARMVLTTPPEVRYQRKAEVQQTIELMKLVVL